MENEAKFHRPLKYFFFSLFFLFPCVLVLFPLHKVFAISYNGLTYSDVGSDFYSTGFESSDNFIAGNDSTSLGSLCGEVSNTPGQNGWSGGNTGSTVLYCYNNFTQVNADGTIGNEKIMANGMNAYTAYSGNQFWRLARTSYSAEQSVPFGPNLADAAGDPSRGANFNTFKATIHIKAAVPGDGSILKLDTGNPSGGDRGNYLAYVYNTPTGLAIRGITNGSQFTYVDLFTNVDATIWHTLDISLVYDGDPSHSQDWVTVTLDGTQTASFASALNTWRADVNGCGGPTLCPYETHSRLQFRTGSQDNDFSTNGFLLDDIKYCVDNSGNDIPCASPVVAPTAVGP